MMTVLLTPESLNRWPVANETPSGKLLPLVERMALALLM